MRGVEVWYNGAFVKRWKYWEYILNNDVDYWIVDKYWQTKGNRNWVFCTDKNELKLLSDTKIVRHTQLRSEMNPYLDKDYFVLLYHHTETLRGMK